ncbi:MAG: hypothetical protein LV481_11780 [Methylacidiphilales bacterium]|nr:hypothetical protein [Candidatus Methylacidiphilales bacterium]
MRIPISCRFHICLGLLVTALVAAPVFADDNFIWIEGENPVSTNMKPHPWYAGQVDKALLSGGDFISNFGPQEGLATYQVNAVQAGTYTFWIRANPVGDPKLDYQLNGADWVPVDFSGKTDVINIAKDNKPDLRFIAWIKVGSVNLQAGQNTIAFKFHSANNNHGSLDCFLFTQAPFTPNGKLKPGQKLGTDEPGWWAFEPGPETFSKDALLDLRSLNEDEAGQSGFIQADGDCFKLGNGQSVRFWGVNVSAPPGDLSKEELDFMAARFAKLGINMVRIHGGLFDRSGDDPTRIDAAKLDNYFYLINALKKQGIYVHLSNYFPLWLTVKASDGIPGTDDIIGKIPFGLLIFEPRMQEIYKSWIRQVLTTKSPYSGKTLAEETSVGVFEIQNEDSLFFWTFQPGSLGKGPRELLEKKFGAWLANKYGSIDHAFAAWPGDKHPEDSAPDVRAGFYGAFEMSSAGFPKQSPDRQKRLLDQIHFLAEVQHDFYADMRKFLRDELGAKWPISASNWTTAPGLGFIERYTYSGVEVIDKHGYFGGKHEGDGAGWSVRVGHTYQDKTAMYDPASVPFQYVRLPGHPHIQTEIAWNKPNRFIAEGEPLISAYASLQGVDGMYLFAAGSGNWENNGGGNWTYMMPGEIGQSPAEALQYRRGDLKPGDTVIRQVTTVDDLLNLKSSTLLEGPNADFRITESPKSDQADQIAGFDPLSFFVGRVERTFDPKAEPVATDLGKYIDRDKKIITSSTGEIVWDYGQGLLTVNSPRSQGVTGFLAKVGPVKLSDVTIESHNDYGTIHVISLDGEPLSTSRKILIQAFTEEKMYGFKSVNGMIQDIGRVPITVRDIDATVTIPNGAGLKAVILDEQGYARGELQPQVVNGAATLTLPRDSLYTILTR